MRKLKVACNIVKAIFRAPLRESCGIQERTRRCNRRRISLYVTAPGVGRRERRMNRKSEDLSGIHGP